MATSKAKPARKFDDLAWLPKEVPDSFGPYASNLKPEEISMAWFRIDYLERNCMSCYDNHVSALGGDPRSIAVMRKFISSLVTERLVDK